MAGIAPEGGAEGLIATQMVAVHRAAMDCLARANAARASEASRAVNLRLAARLMTLALGQRAALAGRGGDRRVTVEHVHVNAGGQAIVGAVTAPPATPGGGSRHETRDIRGEGPANGGRRG